MPVAAVLFAAGRGERLRPLTDEVAKPALPMLGIPLAAFGLSRLLPIGPAVVMNVRHLPRSVTGVLLHYVPTHEGFQTLFEEPEAYGTAGTLVALRDRIGPRVVTWNADVLTDLRAEALREAHSASDAPATVAVREVDAGADFVLQGDRAAAFVDRRRRAGAAGGVFLGAAVFDREVLFELPETRPLGLGETLLASLAASGRLAVYRHRGYWRDVGSPAAYLAASLDLLEGWGPEPPAPWPGEVADVAGGRTFVGAGAVVRGGLRPGAVVLDGAVVEPGATVERAIVWPRERVPAGSAVRDGVWFGGRVLPA
ncbi:MAG: sugar phosphate nucleotidyltransferase [Actinomycetota bacterium]